MLRFIISPFLLCYTIGYGLTYFGPVTLCAFLLGELNDEDDVEPVKANLAATKNGASIICGFKVDHKWSNKKSKLAISLRLLFCPLLFALLLLWYLPLYLYYVTLMKTQNAFKSDASTDVDLDLKLKSSNSDWSGRVLDIVRRVNAITSSESAKTNSKITTLEASNAKLQQDLKASNTKFQQDLDNLTACMNKMMEKFEIDLPKKPSDTPPEPFKRLRQRQ